MPDGVAVSFDVLSARGEVPDGAIVGFFFFLCKIAGRQLVHGTVIGDALAAVSLFITGRVAAIASCQVFLVMFAVHKQIPHEGYYLKV